MEIVKILAKIAGGLNLIGALITALIWYGAPGATRGEILAPIVASLSITVGGLAVWLILWGWLEAEEEL
jgi:hypothetical protein